MREHEVIRPGFGVRVSWTWFPYVCPGVSPTKTHNASAHSRVLPKHNLDVGDIVKWLNLQGCRSVQFCNSRCVEHHRDFDDIPRKGDPPWQVISNHRDGDDVRGIQGGLIGRVLVLADFRLKRYSSEKKHEMVIISALWSCDRTHVRAVGFNCRALDETSRDS